MQTITIDPKIAAIAPLGIGTWAWGDNFYWSYGKDYGLAQVKEAFDAAMAAGITFFDTAEVYGLGESERLLGQFIQAHPQGHNVQVATKYMPVPWRLSAQAVKSAVRASLQRLNLSKIALYQVHQPVSFLMSQKTLMNALADEVEAGRIDAIGVSNYSAAQMREAHALLAVRGIPLVVNQVLYSLLDKKVETNGVLATARELNVKILAYSPLAQGLLTGKYNDGQASPQGARRLNPRFKSAGLTKIAPVVNLLQQLAKKYDRNAAQVALNWLIAQGDVIPIPGAKTAAQATQNAGALGWSLDSSEIEQLNQVT